MLNKLFACTFVIFLADTHAFLVINEKQTVDICKPLALSFNYTAQKFEIYLKKAGLKNTCAQKYFLR